ncbi:regulatory iron-sulfur-containing complex subunit RicT [Aureibaculum sp. 2210JD6-5]|uniref:PSP1 domain-containing protein n=1 Tax=Aureibaculum sp. 2210JD6-5 TaxID=3103957 RepID=UPI002AAC9EF5|nr:regulatory iron-sulfur-containing complex subunit RicT [Aureibaculum sp. 2210JD6-5]MDY7396544.1 regulatory iron-sulfur-containing complex subunit RicT [Aureibaculum sp. 2210JD6-5]
MSCNSCSTDTNGVPKGCKSNGSCGTGSCDKLTVFDWLSNMNIPNSQSTFNIAEVRFKNGRKHFFKNTKNLPIAIGDVVAVESSPGHDIGTVSLTGELVKIQMRKKDVGFDSEEIKQIYRKASQRDIDVWQSARDKEQEVQRKSRLIVSRLGLKMKLSDIEFQGDGNKATFYYTADERVDFRMLIKELASTFKIRVEMKQVGLRQEAARLGGIGSCGRELCCSTWLTDFRSVSTSAARYQQLSLNPQKLAGQCGKLKCCLNYELDSYLDALKNFPKTDTWLQTEKGTAVFQKMDIFKGLLWYAYKDNPMQWVDLEVDQVNEIIKLNKEGKKVASLEMYASKTNLAPVSEKVFTNVVGQDSLTRFDKKKGKKNNKRRKNRNNKRKSPRKNA